MSFEPKIGYRIAQHYTRRKRHLQMHVVHCATVSKKGWFINGFGHRATAFKSVADVLRFFEKNPPHVSADNVICPDGTLIKYEPSHPTLSAEDVTFHHARGSNSISKGSELIRLYDEPEDKQYSLDGYKTLAYEITADNLPWTTHEFLNPSQKTDPDNFNFELFDTLLTENTPRIF